MGRIKTVNSYSEIVNNPHVLQFIHALTLVHILVPVSAYYLYQI